MSTLQLIRHGQASFGAANYDVLSERGIEQSRRLGRHWASRQIVFDAIYVGPRQRQRDTARHAVDAARDAGLDCPDPIELAELDEYPAMELIQHWMPILRADDPELVAILEAPSGSGRLELVMDHIIGKWVRGELDTGHLESFVDFTERVHRGLDQIASEQGRGVRVAAITSGGPISVAMRRTLGLDQEMMLRLAWVVANASTTEFRYRVAGKLALVHFNNTPHIDEPALLTYR